MDMVTNFDRDNRLTIKTDTGTLLLKLVRNSCNNFEILIEHIQPGVMMVGDTLDDALNLSRAHQELLETLRVNKSKITESLLMSKESVNDLSLLWESCERQLHTRESLLHQSVRFHQAADAFLKKMNCACQFIEESAENELANPDLGHSLLEEYQKIKREILESSLSTFEEGKNLLARLKEMSIYADGTIGKHATSSACYSIENLLELLNNRRLRLEEIWKQRKLKIEQCIQIAYLRAEIKKTLDWILTDGNKYVDDSRLGTNFMETVELQKIHNQYEKEHHKPVHESVMRCLRTADQFIHTGLERADEAHQEAHVLLEKWEKFALKLDQRRKLLSVVVSFYKQTEEASERLSQIEREIRNENDKMSNINQENCINNNQKKKRSSSKTKKSTNSTTTTTDINMSEKKECDASSKTSANVVIERVQKTNSPAKEVAQRHVLLSNKLAEASAPGLREARIVLEKINNDNFEAKHVIRKVYEFTEQVNDLKKRLNKNIQEKIEKTSDTSSESRKITEFMEFENKYNNLYSWIINLGETFLTQHRDMGVDIAYVSDYVDNHQQMRTDLKDSEIELSTLNSISENVLKSTKSDEIRKQITQNMMVIEQKWNRLNQSVDARIRASAEYLQFIKTNNHFRNLALDLQEIFKTVGELNESSTSNSILEQHIEEKLKNFERVNHDLIRKGNCTIDILRKSDIDVLKINTNHMISDIEIMMNDATSLFESITKNLKMCRDRLESQKKFRQQWNEFALQARRLIQKTSELEESFFSHLADDFNSTIHISVSYQRRLDDLIPNAKKITCEIDDSITRAEILSLNGDTFGQKEMLVSELTRTRQRFLTRINEYKVLLQMTIRFFNNYKKLEETIQDLVAKYDKLSFTDDLNTMEALLKQHLVDKESIPKLVNFTKGEGEEIIQRVRLNGIELEATDAIRNMLLNIEELKREWERTWEEIEHMILLRIERTQIMIEKNHIERDLDLLLKEIEHRRNNLALSNDYIKQSLASFYDITENMNICAENINRWKVILETAIQKAKYDNDVESEQFLSESQAEVEKKWSRLHLCVKDYRDALSRRSVFTKLYDEVESWIEQKYEIINRLIKVKSEFHDLIEIDKILNQINQHVDEVHIFCEPKLKYLSQLAVEINAPEEISNKIKYISTKNIELKNNLMQLKNEFQEVKISLVNEADGKFKRRTSQMYHDSEAVEKDSAPDFTRKLESVIVLEGSKHCFECIVVGTEPRQVQWLKNGQEIYDSEKVLTSYSKSTGAVSLTINSASQEDNALYACRVSNNLGMAETSAFLKVKEIAKPQGIAPLVISPLESVQLNSESNYTLECIISGEPEPTVTWYKDNIEIDLYPDLVKSTYRTSKFMNVRQLAIFNTDANIHNGTYTCRAKNEYGEAASSCEILVRRPMIRPIQAEINRAPAIIEPLASSYTIKEGKQIAMTCKYSGHPKVDVVWLKDNQPIDLNLMGLSKDFKIIIDVESSTLEIKETYPDDSGVYTVVIRNSLGQARSTTQLFVKENSQDANQVNNDKIPTILRHLKNVEAKLGSFIQLDIFAIGDPQPEIIWYQNDLIVQENDRIIISSVQENKYSLYINKCELKDSGEYRAVVKNEFGQAQSICRLNVNEADIITSASKKKSSPNFVELLKDIRVLEGHDVCFKCRVIGQPEPTLTWYKNGIKLENSSRIKMARQGDNHYLVMNEATEEDAGIYMANAANSEGEAKSYSRLNVRSSSSESGSGGGQAIVPSTVRPINVENVPSPSGRPGAQAPEFKKLFYDQRVQLSESLRLDTIILGSPKPKIKWLFNNEAPNVDNVRCIMAGDNYSFVIENFKEQNCGRYAILAENQHGKATCSAEIVLEGRDFSTSNRYEAESANANSKTSYAEETTTRKIGGMDQVSKTKTITSESHGIDSMPLVMHDFSTQAILPQVRDVSSQSQHNATRESGVQINTDVRDKSSQIEVIHTRDESSQWTSPELEIERIKQSITNELDNKKNDTHTTHHESHFSSSNMDEMNSSYSYAQQSSVVYDSQQQQQQQADCSTTLIKDINTHYEPVELIINRGLADGINSSSQVQAHSANLSSSTYVREIDDFMNRSPYHRFEPVNLIFQKPFHRSGSLPPLVSRINYVKSSARSDFEHTDTETEESYYYYTDRFGHHHHHQDVMTGGAGYGGFLNLYDGSLGTGLGESKMTYYRGSIEKRASRPTTAFKPVELILDASSVMSSSTDPQNNSGKQHNQNYYYQRRDKSLPSRSSANAAANSYYSISRSSRSSRRANAVPIRHRNLVTSSFIYDHNKSSAATASSSFANYDYHQQFNDYDFFNNNNNNNTNTNYFGYTTDSGRYDTNYSISDFVSDQRQRHSDQAGGRYAAYKSLVTEETSKKVIGGQEAKYPTMEMTIDLKAPPTIDTPLSSLNVIEGQLARFECVVSGKPTPSVKWYREGREITETEETNISYEEASGRAVLIIRSAHFKDAAKYTCVARNVIGSCSTSAMLNVKEKNKSYDQPHQSLSTIHYQQQQQQKISRISNNTSKSLPTKYSHSFVSQNNYSSVHQQPNNAESQHSVVRTSTYLIPDQGDAPPLSPLNIKSSKSIQPITTQRPYLGNYNLKSKSFEEQTEKTRYHRAAPEYTVEAVGIDENEFDYTNESIKELAQRFGPIQSLQSPRRPKTNSLTLKPVESKDDLYMALKPSKYRSHYEYNVVQKSRPPKSLIEFPEQEFSISRTTNKLQLLDDKQVNQYGNEFPSWTVYHQRLDDVKPIEEQPRPIVEEPTSPNIYRNNFSRTVKTNISGSHGIPESSRQPGPELLKKLPLIIKKTEGQQVRFEIEIGTMFPPHAIQVSWSKNGAPIENSTDTRISSAFGLHTLIIPEVFCEDSGLYRVLISTPLGTLESFCQLVVEASQDKKKSPSPRSQSDSPRRFAKFRQEEVVVTTKKLVTDQDDNFTSPQKHVASFLSHTEVKPAQDSVHMLPTQPRSSSLSKPISITPLQKPQFAKHLQNVTCKHGHRTTLTCTIKSSPDTIVSWYKNGVIIEPSTDYMISYDKFTGVCTLDISEAFSQDSGQYTCVASNSAGNESSTAWLVVKEKSRPIEDEPQTPSYKRVVSTKSIEQSKQGPLRISSIESSKVEIPAHSPPQPPQADSGHQKPVEIIRAYQKYPEPPQDKQHAEPIKEAQNKPRVLEPLKNLDLVEGGKVVFECRFQGGPLNIQWFKGDRELKNQYRHKMVYDENTGRARLIISTVLEEDADVYTCRASNSLGDAITSAKLLSHDKQSEFYHPPSDDRRQRPSLGGTTSGDDVFEPPTQIKMPEEYSGPAPARIIRGLKNEQIRENDLIVLKALISGNPMSNISWFKNNAPIIMSQRHMTHFDESKKVCSLKIKNAKPDDAGVYTLVIENPYGADQSSGQLLVLRPLDERPRQGSQSVQSPVAKTPAEEPLKMSPPRVLKHLQPETNVKEGQGITLSCMIEGTPIPNITFLKNDQPLQASSRIKTSFNPTNGIVTIKIDDANVYDAASYKVRAENPGGRAETAGIVYVHKAPVIDSRPVVDPDAFKYLPQQSAAPHGPPAKIDGGEFIAPYFVVGLPASSKIHEGEPIKLNCQVHGNPKPTISWLKDGKPLPASLRFNTNYVIPTGVASLTVTGTLQTDCGSYTAVAENPAGKAYTTTQIFVKESGGIDNAPITNPDAFKYLNKPHGKYESADESQTDDDVPLNRAKPPKVIHGLPNLKQLEGEPVVMACKIDGFPKPNLRWYKDGMPLGASTRFTTSYDMHTGVARLKISDTNLNDAGVYTVVAENKAGSDHTDGRLDIEKESAIDNKPIINPDAFTYLNRPEPTTPRKDSRERVVPARIIVPLQNMNVPEGKPCRLVCRVEGHPTPSAVWYKNGISLPASNRYNQQYDLKTGVISLKINDVLDNDSGFYEVIVENNGGNDRTAANLIVGHMPGIDQRPIIDPNAFKYLNSPHTPTKSREAEESRNFQPPKVIIPLKDVRIHEDQPVTFMTKIIGYPIPKIVWLHNGKPILDSTRFTSNYDHTTGVASFKMTSALLNDAGAYTATAENPAGTANTTCQLIVNPVSHIDTTPIVNPDAFRYLNNPSSQSRPSKDDELSKVYPPKVIIPLKDIRVHEGQPVSFMTKIIGYPIPKIIWLLNNRPILDSNRYTANYDHTTGIGSFKINSSIMNDAGYYTAVAENPAGSVDTSASLQIIPGSQVDTSPIVNPDAFKYLEKPTTEKRPEDDVPAGAIRPPRFVIPLSNSNANEGETLELACKLEGYPFPTVTWFKDNRPLPASNRLVPNHNLNSGIVSLKISDLQMGDAGNYTAFAQNRAGQDQTFCSVYVTEIPAIDSKPMIKPDAFKYLETPKEVKRPDENERANYQPPVFIIPLTNTKAEEGEPIQLACRVEGYPKPKITWLKDGRPLPAANRFTTNYDLNTGVVTLRISDSQTNDVGFYLAIAENEVGADQTSCNVSVKQIPSIDRRPMVNPDAFKFLEQPSHTQPRADDLENLRPPKVIVPLSDAKLEEGQTVMLACKIEGYPRPKIVWFKDSLLLPASTRYTTDYELNTNVVTLKIDNAQMNDLGTYIVLAENEAGRDQTFCTVHVQQIPNIDQTPMVNPDAFKFLENPPLRKALDFDDENENLQPPRVIVPLQDLQLKEGEPVFLICKIDGKPKPKLTWFKNSKPLPASTRLESDYNLSTCLATLKINSALKNDIGNYTVLAENKAGKDQTSSKLFIALQPNVDETPLVNPDAFKKLNAPPMSYIDDDQNKNKKENYLPPRVIVPLSDVRIKEGENILMICKIVGQPKPKLTWYKNNELLPASTRYTTDYDLNTGIATLKIDDARLSDIGSYLVVGENVAGKDQTSANTYVLNTANVDQRPLIDPKAFISLEKVPEPVNYDEPNEADRGRPPKFIIHLPKELKINVGERIHMKCKVDGYPAPKLSWTKDNKPFMASTRFTVEYEPKTGEIDVFYDFLKPNDTGLYKCKAENEYGFDETEARLFIIDGPNIDERPLTGNPDKYKSLDMPVVPIVPDADDNLELQPPIVIIPLTDKLVKEEVPIELMCKIIGNPKPKLTWFKDGQPLMASQRCDIDYNLSTCISTLNIKVTKPVDIGTYRVFAENIAGTAETSCNLLIERVPNIDETAFVNPESFKALEFPPKPYSRDNDDGGDKQPVLIVKPLEDQECFEGETATFICEVRGNPRPELSWTKDGHPINAAQRFYIDYFFNEGKAVFSLSNAKLDDQGKYTLEGRNAAGSASTSANLIVKSVPTIDDTSYVNPDVFQQFELKKKPTINQPVDKMDNARLKIIEPLQDFNLVEGQQAVFSCTVDAYPKPEINWFKDDKPLMASQRYATYYDMNMGILTLVIKKAYLDDQGKYTCVASNIAGTDQTSANLLVKFDPNIDETSYISPTALSHLENNQPGAEDSGPEDKYKKPYFVKVPKNTEVRDGTVVRLDCLAFGRPNPVLTWYHNGKEITEDPKHKDLVNEEGVHSLLIDPASFPDSGTYSCVARNKVGEASFSVELKVVDKDALIAPTFIEHLQNLVIPEGKDAVLSCTCSGTPLPTVTWHKEGKVLTPDKEYRIDTNGGHSKLYISEAVKADEGWYQCTAINSAGSTITRTKVTVLPPGAINLNSPDMSQLIKPPVPPEVPGFVTALQKLKHVTHGPSVPETPKSPGFEPIGANFGSIWSKDELQDEETIYNKDRPIPPKFKTHFQAVLGLRERDPARFEAKLIPIGDPTMKLQWLKNGEPLRHASRYIIKYDFGLVSLEMLWTYPEDDGVYECIATNAVGQDTTRAELKCKGNRSIIYDTQLPDGMEGVLKLQELEEKIKMATIVKEEEPEEPEPQVCAPEVIMPLEDLHVDEGDSAKFMVKITGYPRPRVNWFVNKTLCVNGSRFKIYFDGMIHYLDILKANKNDEGVVRCFARNIQGEIESSANLKVTPRPDYRTVLRNAKTGEPVYIEEQAPKADTELTEEELKALERLPLLKPIPKAQKPVDTRFGPKFTKQLEPFKANEGTMITLSVEFTSNPQSEVTWYKDGFQMQSSEDFFIQSTATSSSLRIREAFKSDTGMYQVKLYNEVGVAQTRAYLSVIPAAWADLTPTILIELKNFTINGGDPVKFQTQAQGNPSPVISWFKDDEPLEIDNNRIKEFKENDIYTLLILETVAADSGCYECVAENAYGKAYTRSQLVVLGENQLQEPTPVEVRFDENNVRSMPLSSKFIQPAIEMPLKDQTTKEGSSAKFECIILHSEQATVEWFKEDKLIKQSKYFNMQTNGDKHVLNILEAFPEDEGLYKCMVTNPAGKTSTSAYLKIIQNTQAPSFVKTLNNVEVEENQPAEFSVQISSETQTNVDWTHNGIPIRNGMNNIQIDKKENGIHVLKIKQARPKDSGAYMCKASNHAGTTKTSANLVVKTTLNTRSAPTVKLTKGETSRIEIYFDNSSCKKHLQPLDFADVNWFFKGVLLSPSQKYIMQKHREISILQINRFSQADVGVYAIQAFGRTTQHVATLNVEITDERTGGNIKCFDFVQIENEWLLRERTQKPIDDQAETTIEILMPLQDKYSVTQGKDIKLPVLFRSSLEHKVEWYSDKKILPSSTEKYEMIDDDNGAYLIIKSVTELDQHEYELIISNQKEKKSFKTHLYVEGKMLVADLKPTQHMTKDFKKPIITQRLEPILKVNQGQNAQLSCKFEFCDDNQFEWYFNQTKITEKIIKMKEKYEHIYEPNHSSTLIIKNVNCKDKGDYTFLVKNNQGSCKSICHLDVILPQSKQVSFAEYQSPIIKELKPNMSHKIGDVAK